jgi:hypothetical protein
MISPSAMAMALITVMLWIMWSDTIRGRRPSQILYVVRIMLYLVVSGVMVVNLVRYPDLFAGSARWLTITSIAVGVLGAGYFARKLVRRGA